MVYAKALGNNPLDQSPIAVKQPRKKPALDLLLAPVQTGLSSPEDHNKHKNPRYSRGR